MVRDILLKTNSTSKNEAYTKLSEYCINAMKHRKMNDHYEGYLSEIKGATEPCNCLLTEHQETVKDIINYMEKILLEAHTEELQKLEGTIVSLFDRRKRTAPNTAYGEKEIIHLTEEINILKKRKTISIAEIIESIIRDTLNETIRNSNPKELQYYTPDAYEYHGLITFISQEEHS